MAARLRFAARSPHGKRIILLGEVSVSENGAADDTGPVNLQFDPKGDDSEGDWSILVFELEGRNPKLRETIPMLGDTLRLELSSLE